MEPSHSDHPTRQTLSPAQHHSVSPDADMQPGWEPVIDIHLPRPTYWPAVLALAITFVAWGVVTSALIIVVGLLLFALAVGGWIGDLLHEH